MYFHGTNVTVLGEGGLRVAPLVGGRGQGIHQGKEQEHAMYRNRQAHHNKLCTLTDHRPSFSPIQVYLCEINCVQISFSISNSFINMLSFADNNGEIRNKERGTKIT